MVHTLSIVTMVVVPLAMGGTVMMAKMFLAGIITILTMVSSTPVVMLVFTGMTTIRHGIVMLRRWGDAVSIGSQ